jgi:hypothetical protein
MDQERAFLFSFYDVKWFTLRFTVKSEIKGHSKNSKSFLINENIKLIFVQFSSQKSKLQKKPSLLVSDNF